MSEKIFGLAYCFASLFIVSMSLWGPRGAFQSILSAVLVAFVVCPLIFRFLEPEEEATSPLAGGVFVAFLVVMGLVACGFTVRAFLLVLDGSGSRFAEAGGGGATAAYAEGFAHGGMVLGAFALLVVALAVLRLRRRLAARAAKADLEATQAIEYLS